MIRIEHVFFSVFCLLAGCSASPMAAQTTAALITPPSFKRESQTLCLATAPKDASIAQAIQDTQNKARKLPKHPDAWTNIGREWVRLARVTADPGYYVNVNGCVAEALRAKKDFAPALELRSLVLMNNHQFESARALAEQILTQSPDSGIASGTLSDALLELGRYPEAARASQSLMDSHPGMAASARAAHIQWLHGDNKSAQLYFRDALVERTRAEPEAAAWTFVEAGMLFWQQGDYSGADALFSEALTWFPEYPAALVGRGRVALALGQDDTAITHLRSAMQQTPSVETAWLLGDAYTLGGKTQRAQTAYDAAIQHGRRGDKFSLAALLASKNKNLSEALTLIEQERRSRGGIYIDDVYAWALYRAGRLDEAHRVSQQALRLGTRDARLLFHAGAIEMAIGKETQGKEKIAQALALNPYFDLGEAAEARALVASVTTAGIRN